MSKIVGLSIETSGTVGSVALGDVDPPRILRFTQGLAQGKQLLPCIERLLGEAKIKKPDFLAVGVGPGSYTGLRISVTVARTLAWTWEVPLLGIGSLTALAAQAGRQRRLVVPLIDAKQGEIYAASYRWQDGVPRQVHEPIIAAPEELRTEFGNDCFFLGDGCARMGCVPGIDGLVPDAVGVLKLARQRFLGGERDRIQTVLPLYVRASEAERRLELKS